MVYQKKKKPHPMSSADFQRRVLFAGFSSILTWRDANPQFGLAVNNNSTFITKWRDAKQQSRSWSYSVLTLLAGSRGANNYRMQRCDVLCSVEEGWINAWQIKLRLLAHSTPFYLHLHSPNKSHANYWKSFKNPLRKTLKNMLNIQGLSTNIKNLRMQNKLYLSELPEAPRPHC